MNQKKLEIAMIHSVLHQRLSIHLNARYIWETSNFCDPFDAFAVASTH